MEFLLDVWVFMTDLFATDIVGFYFLELASNYTPNADLESFLSAGPPPIYIGLVTCHSSLQKGSHLVVMNASSALDLSQSRIPLL